MVSSGAIWLVILGGIIMANLPWLSERLLLVFPLKSEVKPVWLGLLELLIFFALFMGLSLYVEAQQMGNVQHQDWEFYAINLFLFFVFSLPGFIFRFQFKKIVMR